MLPLLIHPLYAMRSSTAVVLLAGVALLVTGCIGPGMSTSGTYRETIGTSTPTTIRSVVPQIVTSQYGYEFDRTMTRSGYLRYLTNWREHSVLPAEKEAGYNSTRTRIEVTAQPRDRSAGTYTVNFNAEYNVRKGNSTQWVAAEIPPERQEYIDRIYRDLSDDLTTGVMSR